MTQNIDQQEGSRSVNSRYTKIGEFVFVSENSRVSEESRILSDGTVINKFDLIGTIDFWPPPMEKGEGLVQYSKKLKAAIDPSLKELARLCREENRFSQVKAFGNFTHLARLAPDFGFDVFPIRDPRDLEWYNRKGLEIAERNAQGNLIWELTRKNIKDAQEALISRKTLIERYYSALIT